MPNAFSPSIGVSLPPGRFNTLIATTGQRVGWLRSHGCPCVWSPSPFNNQLSTPGTAQRACKTCLGVGIYWDTPTLPFQVAMTFRERSPTPVEPGVVMNERFGMFQSSEPSLTIPYCNPYLAPGDPQQSTLAWQNASTDDMVVAPDMLARYTAVLQVSGQTILPFQQNLQVASSGAVTIWNGTTQSVVQVSGYAVSGATVTLPSAYPAGTGYMVEFSAAALFVLFRRAGGLPHSRPLGGGTVNEPKVFHLAALDFWSRQRGIQPQVSVGCCVLNLASA